MVDFQVIFEINFIYWSYYLVWNPQSDIDIFKYSIKKLSFFFFLTNALNHTFYETSVCLYTGKLKEALLNEG